MRPARPRLAVTLSLVVLLAACAGLPGPPSEDRTARFGVTNDGEGPVVVTVSVVSGNVTGYRVTNAAGENRTFRNTPSLDDLPTEAVALSVSVVPLGGDVRTERVRLDPGEGVGLTFDRVGRDVTVFYTIANPESDEPMRSVGIGTCGPGASHIETQVTISAGGFIDVSTLCEG